MKLPIIITNFKMYESAVGERAVLLAKIHEKVARETGASIAVAVSALDVYRVASAVDIPVFVQHVDTARYGSATGHIVPEVAKVEGAVGTLLNHSEKRVGEGLFENIARAKEAGLFVVVCAETPEEGARIAATANPDLIAVEPPELIGGDISVSSALPEVISGAVSLIGVGKVLVGAGVKNSADVSKALELGASGVLLASGITKTKDPEAVLRDLVAGLSVSKLSF